jgi:hypothetical protein
MSKAPSNSNLCDRSLTVTARQFMLSRARQPAVAIAEDQ